MLFAISEDERFKGIGDRLLGALEPIDGTGLGASESTEHVSGRG
jgi:hypothetical protein